jgi:hypothetical protein
LPVLLTDQYELLLEFARRTDGTTFPASFDSVLDADFVTLLKEVGLVL